MNLESKLITSSANVTEWWFALGNTWEIEKLTFIFSRDYWWKVLTTTYHQHINCEIVITGAVKLQGLLNSFIVRGDKIDVKNVAKS